MGEDSANAQSALMVGAGERASGAGAGKAVNPVHNRALQVILSVEGPTGGGEQDVLNVQLETSTKTYRDYYIDLNFTGESTIRLAGPTTRSMMPEFRPNLANYSFKTAMYSFRWDDITAVNFRWMRKSNGRPLRCLVKAVEALSEVDYFADPIELAVGSSSIMIPAGLRTDDYAEFWADGVIRVFDKNGNPLSTARPQGAAPMLQSGKNVLLLKGPKPARVELTTITLGPAAK